MASRILSQIFNQNSTSIYETLRQHDAAENSGSDMDDLEERAGMLPLDNELAPDDDMEESHFELRQQPPVPASSSFLASSPNRRPFLSSVSRSRGNRYAPQRFRDDDAEENDEVPASLLLEPGTAGPSGPSRVERAALGKSGSLGAARRAGDSDNPRNQWISPGTQNPEQGEERQAKEFRRHARLGLIDSKERAMWKWANVENLDNFLNDVCCRIYRIPKDGLGD